MSAAEFQSTSERIGLLERKLRRQNRAVIACAAFAVATSLLIGQSPSNRTLEAEKFILRGPQGQELAILDGLGTGAALKLYDGQHRVRVVLTTADAGNLKGLAVFRSNGQVDASLGVADNDNPFVQLVDKQGNLGALLEVADDGPSLALSDKQGQPRAILIVNGEGPSISLHDEQGRPRTDLELSDGGPRMRMWDSNSVVRAAVGIGKGDVPGITVSTGADPKKGSVIIAADAKGGGVLITGPDGRSRNIMR
jgi:hypothetical protein